MRELNIEDSARRPASSAKENKNGVFCIYAVFLINIRVSLLDYTACKAEAAGLATPTRLTRIHAALGKCRPWHLTVGSDSSYYLFLLFGAV